IIYLSKNFHILTISKFVLEHKNTTSQFLNFSLKAFKAGYKSIVSPIIVNFITKIEVYELLMDALLTLDVPRNKVSCLLNEFFHKETNS
ncbi:MAG: hypothetical protein N3A69_13615, partial [Leptospiraceae bacterium]|nr:hypothetical protein [Leptospiraceae bacterium]